MIMVDVETTGVDAKKNSIISIGAVDFSNPQNQFYKECRIWEGAEITQQALYINGFTKEDHLRLMKLLKQTKHAFLLSYEDCPEIRELYSWAKIYKLAFPYRVQDSNTSNSKRKTGQEVVISNIEFSDYEKLRII